MNNIYHDAMQIVRTIARGGGARKHVVDAARDVAARFDMAEKANMARVAFATKKQRAAELRHQREAGRFDAAPQFENGVNYGATGRVLLRASDSGKNAFLRLVWRHGAYDMNLQTRVPAELELHVPGRYWMSQPSVTVTDLTDNYGRMKGGQPVERLVPATIERYREAIDNAFGTGATAMILQAKLKRTVVM